MDKPWTLERREFLRNLGIAAAGLVLGSPALPLYGQTQLSPTDFPKRKFGRHDFYVPAMALGGHTFATASSDTESIRIVHEAIELGVTFMDNAWDYHNGRSEVLMGKALEGKRDKVFLMTKVCNHGKGGKKETLQMLDESLRRLQTDHLDLWQWHAVATMDQVEHGFREGSVVEALEEAKKAGKVRFIGFTGHTEPDVHLEVLKHRYPFDSCQIPLSPIEANSNAFLRRVLPELVKQNIAPLGMKSLGGNAKAVADGVLKVEEALRYAFSLPVAAIVSGINSVEQLRQNAAIARSFVPMPPEEMMVLEQRCLKATESNQYQPYRKWMAYKDGDSSLYA